MLDLGLSTRANIFRKKKMMHLCFCNRKFKNGRLLLYTFHKKIFDIYLTYFYDPVTVYQIFEFNEVPNSQLSWIFLLCDSR